MPRCRHVASGSYSLPRGGTPRQSAGKPEHPRRDSWPVPARFVRCLVHQLNQIVSLRSLQDGHADERAVIRRDPDLAPTSSIVKVARASGPCALTVILRLVICTIPRLCVVGVSGDAKLLLILAITVTGAIGVLVVLTLHVLLSLVYVGDLIPGRHPGPGSSRLATSGGYVPQDEGRHASWIAQPGPGALI
ncbi:MAG: hypothetical protein JO249_09215 [Acidobacteria bacterium]|nr:hypothetical protein [Acidobacteriota bacterium]